LWIIRVAALFIYDFQIIVHFADVVVVYSLDFHIKLLEYLLLPAHKCIHDTLGNPIFQQENTPIHKVAVVMDFFEKYNSI
jgi:hypothetical protein